MKARYLTFFSYIGTTFRRSEKLWIKAGRNYPDPESVQGLMELALLKLRSLNYPKVTLSSRTDGGVHALNASAHFDLEKFGCGIYEPNNVAYEMNNVFFKNNTPIFIKKCMRVNDNFSSRFQAIRRTYLYRLAVLKSHIVLPENVSIAAVIPVEEWRRCQFVRLNEFDVEKFKEGANYLVGFHDFTTFRKSDKLREYKHNRREIYSLDVRPGKALVTDYTSKQPHAFDYWDIEIKGRGFVHNQIRRMIGTLNSVAVGRIDPKQVKVMLQVPSKHSWVPFVQTSPPGGLYLCDVEYKPEDLIYNPETSESVSEEKDEESVSDCNK